MFEQNHTGSVNSLFQKFTGGYRYGFNGQEKTDEVTGTEGVTYDYGIRFYDARLGRFFSVDPIASKYPMLTTYQFASNTPIWGIDLDGLEVFYMTDGTRIGQVGKSTEVRVVNSNYTFDQAKNVVALVNSLPPNSCFAKPGMEAFNIISDNCSQPLGIKEETLIAFASVIDNESSGNKDESFAIGNATMNFIDEGGSSQLKTIDDVVFYNNTFAQGATQSNYSEFKKMSSEEKNSKYGVAAAINAIGYTKGLAGFKDYSNGADSWDGVDLVDTKRFNNHRNYGWSEGSKKTLTSFKNKVNGGIDVSKWSYKKSGFDIKATKVLGKTLFTNLQGGRGEVKQDKTKFK